MSARLARVERDGHGWRAVCICGWSGSRVHIADRLRAERERAKHRQTHEDD